MDKQRSDEYWKEAYIDKQSLLADRGFTEVGAFDFYRSIFPVGSMQAGKDDQSDRGNLVVKNLPDAYAPDHIKSGYSRIIFDDLKGIEKACKASKYCFCLIPPYTCYGKSTKGANRHELFAMAIDLDLVGVEELGNLLYAMFSETCKRPILPPTYIVNSGKGLHLYYLLKEPVRLYRNMEKKYDELKEEYSRYIWDDFTSQKGDASADIKGVHQGFRAVGGKSKFGYDYPVRAFKVCDRRFVLEDFKNIMPDCDIELEYKPKGYTQEQIKEVKDRIEWYKNHTPGYFKQNRGLYDYWKKIMHTKIKQGARYFAIYFLVANGLKCGVPEYEIRRDAWSYYNYFDGLSDGASNRFKKSDLEQALKNALDPKNREKVIRTSRDFIEKRTKISLPPRVKRRPKGQTLTRAEQAREARRERDLRAKKTGKDWREGNGRKNKYDLVQAWKEENHNGKKTACADDLGIAYKTVLRWWDKNSMQSHEVAREIEKAKRKQAFTTPRENFKKEIEELSKEELIALVSEMRGEQKK